MGNWISILLAVMPLLLTPSAHAQDSINPDAANEGDGTQIVVPQRKPAPASPTDLRSPAAAPSTIEIDADACRYAVQHVPAADTEYAAGVDVNGNPVAPADLAPRHPMNFPSTIAIPVTSNVARMLGSVAPKATVPTTAGQGYRADALIGMISLVGGRLSFNGQPIGDDPDVELAALCRNAAGKKNSEAQ
jgi:hypothetical protein